MIVSDFKNMYVVVCAVFYGILCIFSIVTGMMYMSRKRELNPLELPDTFVEKLKANPDHLNRFVFDSGLLTFVVGLVQGLTSFCLFVGQKPLYYYIALGFTIFSTCSATIKLKNKFNTFPLFKSIAYIAILIILLLPQTKLLFNL